MELSRRRILAGLVSGAVVTGFDPVTRMFTGVAEAASPRVRLPRLDGELTFATEALGEAASDFGGIVTRAPWVVLRPKSVEDIVKMVRFATEQRLNVAMRGQGHSVYGQAQAKGGVVIDSRTLDRIHSITAQSADVDAGVTWRELAVAATERGLTPRVLTDYIDLSVGGVLSVGGMGGTTFRYGMVVDEALELTVVTGQGKIVQCSERKNRSLFQAVLGGLGQYGIIVRARVRLGPAQPLARVYQLVYGDLSSYIAAQRAAITSGAFDFVEGLIAFAPLGGYQYILQLACWYSPEEPPDDGAKLGAFSPLAVEVIDAPYLAWLSRVDSYVEAWKAAGVWKTPHPWSDLFLPDSKVESFVRSTLDALQPADVGPGVILLYPFRKAPLSRPFVRTPAGSTLWLFDILRFSSPDPAHAAALVDQNRRLLDRAVAVGGKRYPISAVPVRPDDWLRHYGEMYGAVLAAKFAFDPRKILAPGQRIFSS